MSEFLLPEDNDESRRRFDDKCGNCGGTVEVMAFRGLHYCSEDCRKALAAKENLSD